MITHPNCKINLGLHVVGKRPDGYHDLETIFIPVHDFCDELEITPATTNSPFPTIIQEGIALDNNPDDNLCMKAWQLLNNAFSIPPVQMRLKKNIPFGAGLGGGSSDAAFTIKMLNEMFSLNLTAEAMESYAARIGADCPFFIGNQAAYATGIGDELTPVDFDFQKLGLKVVVELPEGEHVSTREAYTNIRIKDRKSRPDLREAIFRPIAEWRDLVINDFEDSVFPAHSAIAALKEDMYNRGACYASMTGSGAAVFGVFKINQ